MVTMNIKEPVKIVKQIVHNVLNQPFAQVVTIIITSMQENALFLVQMSISFLMETVSKKPSLNMELTKTTIEKFLQLLANSNMTYHPLTKLKRAK